MLEHVVIGSNDIERSRRFYNAVLGTLGASEPMVNKANSGHVRLFYRHDGSTFIVSEPINHEAATFANGGTIAFRCRSPEQVREFPLRRDSVRRDADLGCSESTCQQPRTHTLGICARPQRQQALRHLSGAVSIRPDASAVLRSISKDHPSTLTTFMRFYVSACRTG